jgi:hypothetical protein
MIAGLYRKNNALPAYVTTFVLTVALLVWQWGKSQPLPGSNQLFLALDHLPVWAKWILQLLSIATPAIFLNELYKNLKISRESSQLFALSYVMVSFGFWSWTSFNPVLLAAALFSLILRLMLVVASSPRQLQLLFDAGLLASICFQLYKPAVVLFPVTLLGIVFGGVFRLKALLVWLLGYATPIYLTLAWLYLTDQWTLTPAMFRWDFSSNWPLVPLEQATLLSLSMLLVMTVLGLLFSFSAINLKTNSLRFTQRLFLILLVCSVIAVLLLPGDNMFLMGLFLPIAAFFVGRFLEALGPGWMLNLLVLAWAGLLLASAGIF